VVWELKFSYECGAIGLSTLRAIQRRLFQNKSKNIYGGLPNTRPTPSATLHPYENKKYSSTRDHGAFCALRVFAVQKLLLSVIWPYLTI